MKSRALRIDRPLPPEELRAGHAWFAPAPDLDPFVRSMFLEPGTPFFIEEHEVLAEARIGYLWAFVEGRDRNRTLIGMAQLLAPPQRKWSSLRARWQLEEWYGEDLDFLITLSAPFCLECTDAEFLALLDHELSHCCQAELDGMRRFHEDGSPMWGMRGHDVEQFVGVVERWGAAAAGVEQLVAAAKKAPRFGAVDIQRVLAGCGTCTRVAA